MKKPALLFAFVLSACGVRVEEPGVVDPPATNEPTPPPVADDSELLRVEPAMCAFGSDAGHLVWIDEATRQVKVARATTGSRARVVGTAASTCALSVRGTRLCYGDSGGSLTCLNVDGAGHEVLGDRRPADPVRSVDASRGRGVVFGRRRTVSARFDYEETLTTRTVPGDIVATVGDFDPSPDDGVELAVLTSDRLLRISYGDEPGIAVAAPKAAMALAYSSYLVLGADGTLRTVDARKGPNAPLPFGGSVQAFAFDGRESGENLVIARDGRIVAAVAQLYFEPRVSAIRDVAASKGDVLAMALDELDVVWATKNGEVRRAKRIEAK